VAEITGAAVRSPRLHHYLGLAVVKWRNHGFHSNVWSVAELQEVSSPLRRMGLDASAELGSHGEEWRSVFA